MSSSAPAPAPHELPQQRLLELLRRHDCQPLILLVAPAGSGKSMLAAAYARTCGSLVGWLTLQADDRDARTFFGRLADVLEATFAPSHAAQADAAAVPVMEPALHAAIARDGEGNRDVDNGRHRRGDQGQALVNDVLAEPPLRGALGDEAHIVPGVLVGAGEAQDVDVRLGLTHAAAADAGADGSGGISRASRTSMGNTVATAVDD